MAVTWQNKAYIPLPFSITEGAAKPNLGAIPIFQQITGVLPGSTPRVGSVVTPSPVNIKPLLAVAGKPPS